MSEKQPGKWNRLPKMNFSAKDLSKRMKKVETATVRHAKKFVFTRIDNVKEIRRHIAIWVLMVGYIIAATALQLSWYQQGYKTVAAGADGTYAEAVQGPLNSLNPLFASSSAEQSVSSLLFSRLMSYDSTGHLNYDLASSMKVDDDEEVYTVTIRPDAQWHDGRQVTATDVAFTIDLIKNPLTRSTISGWDNIEVEVIDETTITFALPAGYAAFAHALNFPILPEHLLADVDPVALREANYSNQPVGSGPFTFRLLQAADDTNTRKVVYLARNADYYKGAPRLERFQLHVYDSPAAIVRALSASEVNAAVDVSVSDLEKVDDRRYNIDRKPISAGVYALFNTTSDLLKDKAVRKALVRGTDVNEVRAALGEETPVLDLPFVPGQLSGNLPKKSTFDQDAARAALEKAGWKLADGQTVRTKGERQLSLNVVTIEDSDYEKALEKLTEQWRQLGIGVATTIVDADDPNTNIVQTVLQPRQYDVLIYQLVVGGDPDVYAYWHSSQAQVNERGFNLTNYDNSLADDALISARSLIDPELRNAKYLTFAKQWLSDAPAIGLYQSTVQYVSNRSINTLQPSTTLVAPVDRYSDVVNWSVTEKSSFTTP